MESIAALLKFLHWIIYILWWLWPFYYVTWPLTAILIFSARNEYKKSGGGFFGLLKAVIFAVKTLPSTTAAAIRLIAGIIVLVVRASTQVDLAEKMPTRLRNWLNLGGTQTKIVERVVEKRVEVPGPPGRVTFRRRLAIGVYAGIFWVPVTFVATFMLLR
jgi:hypothetical protein